LPVVVDDRLLLDVLVGAAPLPLVRELEDGGLYTTSCAYYRLGRAVTAGSGKGSLSGRLEALGLSLREQVLGALSELPDSIGLINPRVLVPVMFELRVRRPLNMLNAEGLAVAVVIGGGVVVSTDSPLLRSGAEDLGIPYQVLA